MGGTGGGAGGGGGDIGSGGTGGIPRYRGPFDDDEEEDETVGTDDKPAVVNTQSVKEVRMTYPINTSYQHTLSIRSQ